MKTFFVSTVLVCFFAYGQCQSSDKIDLSEQVLVAMDDHAQEDPDAGDEAELLDDSPDAGDDVDLLLANDGGKMLKQIKSSLAAKTMRLIALEKKRKALKRSVKRRGCNKICMAKGIAKGIKLEIKEGRLAAAIKVLQRSYAMLRPVVQKTKGSLARKLMKLRSIEKERRYLKRMFKRQRNANPKYMKQGLVLEMKEAKLVGAIKETRKVLGLLR